ncbi:hypothetical protein SARC_02734 [Sphaeroforma arctica JP610]|uniref:RGS domain-containing protein n=1 Tax=Sphaeroforma arctica JP610 TaxID=667725 RepID=A0A0L0G852_9EUKA|nr:hypothetical protein SARC_02734 [Sphaeroforma arctica JP610]KNC85074.1 hypothetical protein SARC_02734 [Sphaeroforma arctica JP610]|eukprot:XP_014158976.1 hypothetical protein SARC_02734 [Sphaeroforma arctica JP610]
MTGVDKSKIVNTKMRLKTFKDGEVHSEGSAIATFQDGSDTLRLPMPMATNAVNRKGSRESRHKYSRSHDHSNTIGKDENGHKNSLNTPSVGSLKLSGSKRNFSDGKQYNSPFRKAKKYTAPTKSMEREVSMLEILNIWSHKQRLEFYAYLRREFIEENYLALDAIGDILQQHRLGVLTVESVRSKVYQLYFSPDATWTVEVPLELALELDELLGFDADVFGMNGFGAVKHQVKLTDVVNLMQRVYQTLESSVTKSFISFTGEANLTAYYFELMSEHAGTSPRAPPIKHAHEARSPFGQRRSKYSDKSPVY